MGQFNGLDLLETFIVVAEELNFRRSAERLHLDQSALSRRIQKLEHLLGFALLERTTREVALTQAGRNFYNDNKGVLGTYARSVEVAQAISRGHSGVLTIAYMAFAAVDLMPRAVALYRQMRPHVAVNLQYVRTQGQKILLANGEIDIGYLLGPLDHDDFESIRLASDRLCVVSPQNHPINRARTLNAKDVGAYPLVLGDMAEWEFYRWRLNELFSRDGTVLDVAFQASNTLAILGLVRAGLGVTILPESLIPTLHAGLEARPIEQDRYVIDTLIAWRKKNTSRLVRDFINTASALPARY
jgi:DNA-binding transcriptional LysR family regulator